MARYTGLILPTTTSGKTGYGTCISRSKHPSQCDAFSTLLNAQPSMIREGNRRRSAAESYVQLLAAGDARAERSSAARDPGDGGRSAHSTFPAVRRERLLMEEMDYNLMCG